MKFTAWSYSRWSDYKKCPHFAMLRHLKKVPETPGPALIRGREVHKHGELYLTAPRKPREIPPALSYFEADFEELRKQKAQAEGKWAFDKNWEPVGYFDNTVACRMILDVFVLRPKNVARAIDLKTGREYPIPHEQQLELYSVGAFSTFPDLKVVIGEMWYLDLGHSTDMRFTRKDDYDKLRKRWDNRVKPMLKDRKFEPTPSYDACRWCQFHQNKGGPCKKGFDL